MSARATPRAGHQSAATRAVVGLLVFQALGAIGGGLTFLIDTSGTSAGLHPDLLSRTPFEDFLWPGVLLTVGLGAPALVLAASIVRRSEVAALSWLERMTGQHWAWAGTVLLGVALMVWIVVQVRVIEFSWLQPVMFGVGVGLAVLPMTAGARRDLARTPSNTGSGGPAHSSPPAEHAVDLYWIPLGAGASVVRFNGRVYELVHAAAHRRRPADLYHAALEVRGPEGRFIIELTPVPAGDRAGRGVVCDGPVGSRWLGRFRLFRYELHCWRDGIIPDLDQAVTSPRRLTEDPHLVGNLLDAVPTTPTPVWGRDELHTGEMWNSNSVIAWLIDRAGIATDTVQPPPNGRAPGWNAGLVVAQRERSQLRAARRAPGCASTSDA